MRRILAHTLRDVARRAVQEGRQILAQLPAGHPARGLIADAIEDASREHRRAAEHIQRPRRPVRQHRPVRLRARASRRARVVARVAGRAAAGTGGDGGDGPASSPPSLRRAWCALVSAVRA